MSWKFAVILFITVLLAGCGNDNTIDVPNVDHIEVSVDIRRFEQDLFAIDTNNVAADLASLEAAYPEFSEVYFTYVFGLQKTRKWLLRDTKPTYRGFLQHPAIQYLYDTTQMIYPNLGRCKNGIRTGI